MFQVLLPYQDKKYTNKTMFLHNSACKLELKFPRGQFMVFNSVLASVRIAGLQCIVLEHYHHEEVYTQFMFLYMNSALLQACSLSFLECYYYENGS